MPADPLSLPEREEIRAGIAVGEPMTRIAARLGRHRCTISAEVHRNGGRGSYRATAANKRADEQRARPKTAKLLADSALSWHVTKRLLARDSPMTISIELARGTHGITAALSHEAIYQAIYTHGARGLPAKVHGLLHRRHRCRKRRLPPGETTKKRSPLGLFNPIHARPAIVDQRTQIGHLEGDLICGAYNRSAIVTVFDRTTRMVWLAGYAGHHDADATVEALTELFARINGEMARTLTWDQGREMAGHATLTAQPAIPVYFCDPHSPWQRPTNENGNGLLRRYSPKSTDLSIHTPKDLRRVEHRLNTMPRRSLNWNNAQPLRCSCRDDRLNSPLYDAAVAMTG
ncbi:MAG: IS30 family transposase [Aquihabitans sp.]